MEWIVRRLDNSELDAALSLAWKTYLEFEAPDYSPEGVETFKRDIIENMAFRNDCLSGKNRIWGAFDALKLVGIIAVRGESHICLVFTLGEYHRRGIATAIFNKLLIDVSIENPNVKQITLNSSPYGLPFYHHIGFIDGDTEQTKDGIRYTPMYYQL
jgi:GNAT superfamily N-acetyltransferase